MLGFVNAAAAGAGPHPSGTAAETGNGSSMGKGDIRTRRGKINRGSWGVTRPKKAKKEKAERAGRRR